MADTTTNNVSQLQGLFKKQYHDKIEELIPQHAILQKLIDFVPSDKMNGDHYAIPTLLRSNQGVTYLGESGAAGTLKSPKPGVMKEAQVKGSELNVRGQLPYKVLSQASSQGARAFKKASAWLVEDLNNVAYTRLEIAALYGQSGIGTVSAISGTGTSRTITLLASDFAPGLWVLLEGATIEFFDPTLATNRGVVGTVSTVTTTSAQVALTFATDPSTAIVVNDVIFFEGANAGSGAFNEMVGLYKQLSASSGTLFNIDHGAYSLMQGNVVSSVGSISKAKIISNAMLAVDKGQMADLTCLVGTAAWANLWAEDVALRMYDSSYSEDSAKSGVKELVYASLNGQIKVVCHPLVKAGHVILFNPDEIVWVGSVKGATFEIPGMSEQFFRLVQDTNAVELQCYADCALYALKPARAVVLTGVS